MFFASTFVPMRFVVGSNGNNRMLNIESTWIAVANLCCGLSDWLQIDSCTAEQVRQVSDSIHGQM